VFGYIPFPSCITLFQTICTSTGVVTETSHLKFPITLNLLTYLFTYLLIYLLTYLLTYLLIYLLIYLLTYLFTYLFTYLLTYLFTYLLTYLLTYLFTYLLIYLLTYLLTYLFTYLFTYLLTYLLTPCITVLLEMLTGFQLVKKFSTYYGTRMFVTAFTSARHLSLSSKTLNKKKKLFGIAYWNILLLRERYCAMQLFENPCLSFADQRPN